MMIRDTGEAPVLWCVTDDLGRHVSVAWSEEVAYLVAAQIIKGQWPTEKATGSYLRGFVHGASYEVWPLRPCNEEMIQGMKGKRGGFHPLDKSAGGGEA